MEKGHLPAAPQCSGCPSTAHSVPKRIAQFIEAESFSIAKRNYPLVHVYMTMDNHHFSWENSIFLRPFSIAMLNYKRVNVFSDVPF